LRRNDKVDASARRLVWLGLIILLVVGLDQVTKVWALNNIPGQPPISLLGDTIRFSLVFNEGGAMGTSLGPSVFYLILTFIVLPLIVFYLWKNRQELSVAIPLALVCGGAIGNLTDRIRLGRVVDFIDVDFPDISLLGFELTRWWTFNVADAAISCAIAFLFIRLFFQASDHQAGQGEVSSEAKPVDSAESPAN